MAGKRQVVIVRLEPTYSYNFDSPISTEPSIQINEEEFQHWEKVLQEYTRLQRHLERLWRENREKR